VGEEGCVEATQPIDLELSLDEGAEDELRGRARVGLPFLIGASQPCTDEDRLPAMQEALAQVLLFEMQTLISKYTSIPT